MIYAVQLSLLQLCHRHQHLLHLLGIVHLQGACSWRFKLRRWPVFGGYMQLWIQ
jgi:hypothetical protein